MKYLLVSLKCTLFVAIVIFIALVSAMSCCRVYSLHDLRIFVAMSNECHPVWKDLHWGTIQAGQDVEEVIQSTKPVRIQRLGQFVQLGYQPGLSFTCITLTAKDGKLVSAHAGSCCWSRTFFDTLTPNEEQDLNDEFTKYYELLRKAKNAKHQEEQ